jgi:hypothetical protein
MGAGLKIVNLVWRPTTAPSTGTSALWLALVPAVAKGGHERSEDRAIQVRTVRPRVRPMSIGRRVHYGLAANSPISASVVKLVSPLLDVMLSR